MKQTLMLGVLVLLCSCASTKESVVCTTTAPAENSATWINANGEVSDSKSTSTWNMRSEAPYYMYPGYYNQGQWVETPAKIFGAVGVLPGTLVGCVISLPLLPFYEFETTVESSNVFFGRGFSLILGSPFYVTKLIFWDVPKSWFEE